MECLCFSYAVMENSDSKLVIVFFQEIIFVKGFIGHTHVNTALQTCSCVLVLNFPYNTIFFIKNVTCYLFLCIRLYRWFDVHVSIFFTTFLYLCVLEAISFVVNYERHCLKIYGVFHFSDTQCCHFFGENGVFLDI